MIKLLVFDLDGTLVDSRQDLCNSVNFALEQATWPPLPLETIMANVGNGARNLIENCLIATMDKALAMGMGMGNIRPSPEAAEAAYSVFARHYLKHCLVETRLFPGLEKILRALTDYRKSVLTNKPGEPALQILKGLRIDSYFELILGGDNPFGLKPDPAGLSHIMGALGCSPAETVMIGDGEQDAEAARRAGVRFIGFLGGIGSRQALLRTEPDAVIEVMTNLPQALAGLNAFSPGETVSPAHGRPA